MFWHTLLTTISLVFFASGFLLIGLGAESKSETRRGVLPLIGFALVVVNMVFLGSVVLSQTLAPTD